MIISDNKDIDQLFLIAEQLSQDFSLFPDLSAGSHDHHIRGLISREEIKKCRLELKQLDVDAYIERVVAPSESNNRPGAKSVVAKLAQNIIREIEIGPLYIAEADLDFGHLVRRVGFICQNREEGNGAWMPQHHERASAAVHEFARLRLPIITFIDTPGASAGEEANQNNQAHSISRLITEMANVDVPSLGVILGAGYSGGAIPLATTNLLLCVRDGIFNTIQPQGLASIARKYNLSWQECAKYVGVSAYELFEHKLLDGIIDYSPFDRIDMLQNLHQAIITGIESIEASIEHFARENPYLFDHYKRSVSRYLAPSDKLRDLQRNSKLGLAQTPTEHPNVFGVTCRYLRYLSLRRRIKSSTVGNYGRLAEQEVPTGQLSERQRLESEQRFKSWLQAPDKVKYDEELNKLWRNYCQKTEERTEDRNALSRLFFGEPEDNYVKAKQDLCFGVGLYLYNRWKNNSADHFSGLLDYLENHEQNLFLFKVGDVKKPKELIEYLLHSDSPIARWIHESLHFETQAKLRDAVTGTDKQLKAALAELLKDVNDILNQGPLPGNILQHPALDEHTRMLHEHGGDRQLEANRRFFDVVLSQYLKSIDQTSNEIVDQNANILDIVTHEDLRADFIGICHNMLTFGTLYDYILQNLKLVAREANANHSLSKSSVSMLMENALEQLANRHQSERLSLFKAWLEYFVESNQRASFLKQVEEWKKLAFPRVSETLFVIITFIFEKILSEYFASEHHSKEYIGKISPARIGRRKDFWNRLTIAYQDLLIQEVLDDVKRQKLTTIESITNRFFTHFTELNSHLMSADPVRFPGFRSSIESAFKKNITPCGLVTGIGTIEVDGTPKRVGVLISNLAFQAGAFDMASAEKFCKLLVECAQQHIPVIGFVSSGGMQTKEGAAALFSMAIVNDRITRFVRDHDLPIVMFGFGDCTGGAQASFVTHPMVQSYYFSGTNMPFAGQIVVPSYLPSGATLSNYLSEKSEAMNGLVKHPFVDDLDTRFKEIDPDIPVAQLSVNEVLNHLLHGFVTPAQADSSSANQSTQTVDTKRFQPVQRVLVHARGCTAYKLVKKAQENDINVVLVQSDPDMNSTAADLLGEKDRLVCIGGNTPDESYLNAMSVIRVADREGADALHPGIGFLSENAQFATLVANHNINFVGPSVSAMETMGNKSNAINTAKGAGVKVVPGSHGILSDSAHAARIAKEIGYPVLLKAVHGGGGKGIQVVRKPEEIHELFHRISREAKSAFGNGDVYLEKYITSLRHIEIQVLRDSLGNTKILGLRDCSVQRNNQKIIEESGSTLLPDELANKAFDYAEKLANAVNYVGAGTVEFIYDLDSNDVYFMEMNTRLQVEHPVTEWTSGVDIVSEQFRIASGESIEKLKVKDKGYAIEVRITAEKAAFRGEELTFLPTPGTVTECSFPKQNHVEVIPAIAAGKEVTPFYDSMIAQVIIYGRNRSDTIKKTLEYLSEVKVAGICTNLPLLNRILKDEVFNEGNYDTGFLPNGFFDRIDTAEMMLEMEATLGGGHALGTDAIKVDGSDELKVLSPASSIFYSSPTPNDPAFVREGDIIDLKKTLCLMEAMKIFTPLTLGSFNNASFELYPAQQKYQVVRVMNSDGQQVNQGDLLFVIRPIGAETK